MSADIASPASAPSGPPLCSGNYVLSAEEQAAFDAEPDIKVITYRQKNHLFPLHGKRAPGTLYESVPGSPPVLIEDLHPRSPSLWHQFLRFCFCFATVHNICFGLLLLAVSFALCYAPLHWLVPVAVALFWAWYVPRLCDRKEGQQSDRASIWPWLQNHPGWRYTHEWGNVEIARLAKLDPRRQYMFGFYPHGILLHSRLSMWGGVFNELFPGLQIPRIFAASVLFSIPGSRELCLWLGAIDARRSSAHRCLRGGHNSAVYPGGTAEILTTDGDSTETTLLSRSGFVRLAIQYGVPIVPVFAFGEKHMYRRVRLPRWLDRLVYAVLRMPMIFFAGFLGTWVPLRRELTVVYGAPIETRKTAEPTDAEVAAVLAQFMGAERAIFDTFRTQVGFSERESLVIIDAKKVTGVKDKPQTQTVADAVTRTAGSVSVPPAAEADVDDGESEMRVPLSPGFNDSGSSDSASDAASELSSQAAAAAAATAAAAANA